MSGRGQREANFGSAELSPRSCPCDGLSRPAFVGRSEVLAVSSSRLEKRAEQSRLEGAGSFDDFVPSAWETAGLSSCLLI